jgi:hypothetical protein
MSIERTIEIYGEQHDVPAGAIAYRCAGGTQPVGWIYSEDEARRLISEDPNLMVWVLGRFPEHSTAELASAIDFTEETEIDFTKTTIPAGTRVSVVDAPSDGGYVLCEHVLPDGSVVGPFVARFEELRTIAD